MTAGRPAITVIEALERGLQMPEARGKASPEVNNARVMLAYYYLQAGIYTTANYYYDKADAIVALAC